MTTQVVRPAGAGHESLWVAVLSLSIILLAATVISLRSENHEEESVAAHQIDARRDLITGAKVFITHPAAHRPKVAVTLTAEP